VPVSIDDPVFSFIIKAVPPVYHHFAFSAPLETALKHLYVVNNRYYCSEKMIKH
tara:strand:- start:27 stop:188 length:162 start_codon:yes stop_codon:yes gene_type:complete